MYSKVRNRTRRHDMYPGRISEIWITVPIDWNRIALCAYLSPTDDIPGPLIVIRVFVARYGVNQIEGYRRIGSNICAVVRQHPKLSFTEGRCHKRALVSGVVNRVGVAPPYYDGLHCRDRFDFQFEPIESLSWAGNHLSGANRKVVRRKTNPEVSAI